MTLYAPPVPVPPRVRPAKVCPDGHELATFPARDSGQPATCNYGHKVYRDEEGRWPWETSPSSSPAAPRAIPTPFTAADLLGREFPEPRYAVPEILPEGASLLASRAKMGKSWLALGLAVAIASGGRALGQVKVEEGDVLYLALEDGPRRLQGRLRDLLGDALPPTRLHFQTEWPAVDQGGLDALELWLAAHPGARLVVVDTLKRVRGKENGNRRLYDLDYEALAPLQALAMRYGVCILIVHHTKKGEADDPLDLISGSTGLTAAVDGALVIKRTRGQADATLSIVHRDLKGDLELALQWDAVTTGWVLLGDAAEHQRSKERNDVLCLLHDAPGPLTPKDAAEALSRPYGATKKLLWMMAKDGEVKGDRGAYTPVAPRPDEVPGNGGNRGNPVTRPGVEVPSRVTGAPTNGNPSGYPVTALSLGGNPKQGTPPGVNGARVTGLPGLPLVAQHGAEEGEL